MEEIEIKKLEQWCYNFEVENYFSFTQEHRENCCYCHTNLDAVYSYIIRSLREDGLLSDDYIVACCYCQTLVKVGLVGLTDYCNYISYRPNIDILIIDITIQGHHFYFNIHDASKVLKD